MRTFLIAIAVLNLAACATTGRIDAVEIGMPKDQVIQLMGNPVSVGATEGAEYLNYQLFETNADALNERPTPYFVRIVNGVVDSFGRKGDYDSTKTPKARVDSDERNQTEHTGDLYTELRKLKELKDDGILTEEEFDAQKAKLLRQ